ncbi:MAG: hypothetical protein V3W20_06995, partial [Candidatus Neomarinimicrobiota bacterium]
MSEGTKVDVGLWSLFAQIGPDTAMVYLGCSMMGDIDEALGDLTQKFCPDPVRGGWKVDSTFQGAPSPATFDVTTPIMTTANELQRAHCPVSYYVVYVPCGQIQLFQNWGNVGIIAPDAIKTNRSFQVLRQTDPNNNGESINVGTWAAGGSILEIFDLEPARQSIIETEAINFIISCNNIQCASGCGTEKDTCQDLFIGTDAPAGSPSFDADVWLTTNGGANWSEIAIDPFGPGEDIASGVCVDVDSSTTRLIIARGTTDAANPAEIAYTDDSGLTWTNVDVGST